MIDEQRLRDAKASVEPRPLAQVLQRGRRLRRRRLQKRVAAAGAAVVALAVFSGAVFGVDDGSGERTELAAGAVPVLAPGPPMEECSGFAELRATTDAEGLRLYPTTLPDGVTVGATWARAELLGRETCPRVPLALVLGAVNDAGGVAAPMITLEGPSPVPFLSYEGPSYEPAEVRGRPGELITYPSLRPEVGLVRVEWTEADGTTWALTASGGPGPDDLRRVAGGLIFDPTGEEPPATAGVIPADLEVLWQLDTPVDVRRDGDQRWWHVESDEPQPLLSIEVSDVVAPLPPVARAADAGPDAEVHLVDVRGRGGIVVTSGGSTTVEWLESERVRVQVTLRGHEAAAALAVAESLEPIAADDPRIRPL